MNQAETSDKAHADLVAAESALNKGYRNGVRGNELAALDKAFLAAHDAYHASHKRT